MPDQPLDLGAVQSRHEKLVDDMLKFSIRVLYQPDGQQAHADRAALLSVLTATRQALEKAAEWSAAFPLNEEEVEPDRVASADVYRSAMAALALATDAP